MTKKYERKTKEKKPVVAICYDFDKTLTPDDMQAQGFIQSVGYDVDSFWKQSNKLAEDNGMDQKLAYMYTMIQESQGIILEHYIISSGLKEMIEGTKVSNSFEKIYASSF